MTTSVIAEPDHSLPTECDIVMKGGITSGVVYPKLVSTLAGRYRFRNVGGTSAGAIAAAATAAAEYGRQHANATAFSLLENLPKMLSDPVSMAKGSMLFNLFQPVPALKRHYGVLTSMLNAADAMSRVMHGLAGLISHFAPWALLGSMLGLVPLVALYAWLHLSSQPVLAEALMVAWCVGLAAVCAIVVALLRFIFTARDGLVSNYFGFCSGLPMHAPKGKAAPALTSWLTDYYQQLAGLPESEILTFGHLWGSSVKPAQTRNIDLQMMTTALNMGRPYAFPFRTREFYFDPNELANFLPKAVVDHLLKYSSDAAAGKKTLYCGMPLAPLPDAEYLPVVLGVRMSLSFPILLQTIPLYAVDYSLQQNQKHDAKEHEATRIMFSDGGLCSNFPLHFFDALLPMRPTFAIDLTEFPPEHTDTSKDRVWLPAPNVAVRHYIPRLDAKPSWNAFGKIIGAMMDAARCWRDNLQEDVPGYRERIVHVRQTPQEGGLNLNMPAPAIEALGDAGKMAANCLIDHFASLPPPGHVQGWRAHEFIRLRSLLGILQQDLTSLSLVFRAHYKSVVSQKHPPVYPFRSASQQAEAESFLGGLAAVGVQLESSRANMADGAPRPAPDLDIDARP